MRLTSERKRKLTWWIIGVTAACIVIFLGIQNIRTIGNAISWIFNLIAPLLLGVAIALILNVPMSFLESHFWKNSKNKFWQKMRRPLAFVVSLIVIIGILVGIVWLVIPELFQAITVIVQTAIGFINELSEMDKAEIANLPFGGVLLNTDWSNLLDTLQTWLKTQSGTIVNTAFGTVGSLIGGLFDVFIALFFSVYVLFSKEKLKAQAGRLIRAWLPQRFGGWFIHASSVANTNFRSFVSGQSLEAVILGVLCMIGMFILQIPYAPMVGALVGVTALIPVVGALAGAIVGAFMILTVSPIKAVIFVIYLIILQQIEGNVIYPKVMGSRVNLPGLWILAAVTVGGGIAGPVGMLLSVPVASTAYVLVREATEKREQKRMVSKPSDTHQSPS